MARVSETNQQNHRRNGSSASARQPRIATLIRRNGTWREVAFERRAYPVKSPGILATAAPQE
jgi:hypothetical protein